jgi:pilin isopeptide linkage protein
VADDPPTFQIYKQDQWGNPVAGVTFTLYRVALKDDGTAGTETSVAEVTTDSKGYATFSDISDLDGENAIYCFRETSAPTGYQKSNDATYFYFVTPEKLNVDGAIGIGYADKVFEVTNNLTSASYAVPLEKTINDQHLESNTVFNFTLTLAGSPNGASVYTDEACTTSTTTATATITGSGITNCDTLYFREPGNYTFTLTEDDLSQDAANSGFTKSDAKYVVIVTVGTKSDTDSTLVIKGASYYEGTPDKIGKTFAIGLDSMPTFNNILSKEPVEVTLEATKKLTGADRENMKAGEFTFEVVEDEVVVATGRVEADTDGDSVSKITFTPIPYDLEDLGTHILTIYEVEGNDPTIDYSNVVFFATITVDAAENSNQLTASVSYSTQFAKNLENGKPVFTNKYTPISTTGVPTEFVPFVMMAAAAVSVGAVLTVCKWRRRKARN